MVFGESMQGAQETSLVQDLLQQKIENCYKFGKIYKE